MESPVGKNSEANALERLESLLAFQVRREAFEQFDRWMDVELAQLEDSWSRWTTEASSHPARVIHPPTPKTEETGESSAE